MRRARALSGAGRRMPGSDADPRWSRTARRQQRPGRPRPEDSTHRSGTPLVHGWIGDAAPTRSVSGAWPCGTPLPICAVSGDGGCHRHRWAGTCRFITGGRADGTRETPGAPRSGGGRCAPVTTSATGSKTPWPSSPPTPGATFSGPVVRTNAWNTLLLHHQDGFATGSRVVGRLDRRPCRRGWSRLREIAGLFGGFRMTSPFFSAVFTSEILQAQGRCFCPSVGC